MYESTTRQTKGKNKMKIKFMKNGIQTDAVCDLGFKHETVHLLTSDLFKKSINVNTCELKELLKVSYLCTKNNEFCTQFKNAVRAGLIELHSSFETKKTTAEDHHFISFVVLYNTKGKKLGILLHVYVKNEHLFTREFDMNVLRELTRINNDNIRSKAHTIIRDLYAHTIKLIIFFEIYKNNDIVLMYELLIDKVVEALNELKDNYNNYLEYKNYNR